MIQALILAQQADSAGPSAGGGGGGGSPFDMSFLILMLGVLAVFWFIMIRPQRKQEKQRKEMLSQMAKNDHIVTIGGVHGIIYAVEDNEVILKIDERNDVRIRVAKSAIAHIVEKAGESKTSAA